MSKGRNVPEQPIDPYNPAWSVAHQFDHLVKAAKIAFLGQRGEAFSWIMHAAAVTAETDDQANEIMVNARRALANPLPGQDDEILQSIAYPPSEALSA
jgi:hypothetical protein